MVMVVSVKTYRLTSIVYLVQFNGTIFKCRAQGSMMLATICKHIMTPIVCNAGRWCFAVVLNVNGFCVVRERISK